MGRILFVQREELIRSASQRAPEKNYPVAFRCTSVLYCYDGKGEATRSSLYAEEPNSRKEEIREKKIGKRMYTSAHNSVNPQTPSALAAFPSTPRDGSLQGPEKALNPGTSGSRGRWAVFSFSFSVYRFRCRCQWKRRERMS